MVGERDAGDVASLHGPGVSAVEGGRCVTCDANMVGMSVVIGGVRCDYESDTWFFSHSISSHGY